LRLKQQPLPASYLAGAAIATALFNGVPLLQEFFSCLKARRP
jgi:hypothetical protein